MTSIELIFEDLQLATNKEDAFAFHVRFNHAYDAKHGNYSTAAMKEASVYEAYRTRRTKVYTRAAYLHLEAFQRKQASE
jgi:hypothetical protein